MISTVSPYHFIYISIRIVIFKHLYNILVLWGPTTVDYVDTQRDQLNEITQYKTVCSWSLLLLHNPIGSVLWADEMQVGYFVLF